MLNRAAPPGSMRYFSLLYTDAQVRSCVGALYAIDAEIRESGQSVNHDVAHTRLQWWRLEIDRLVNGTPQHPASKVLNADGKAPRTQFSTLHELVAAADMDLARMTYVNISELRAYCARSGGATAEVIATVAGGYTLDAATRTAANRIGLAVRLSEIIRDCRADTAAGRLYVPLDVMDQHGVTLKDFIAKDYRSEARAALRALHEIATGELDGAMSDIPRASRAYLRPLLVLGALHRQLLKAIAARDCNVAGERIELGVISRPWIAWRAARRAT